MNTITQIKKRNGTTQAYDINKIVNAVRKALIASGEGVTPDAAETVASRVNENLLQYCADASGENLLCVDGQPSVKEIHDLVERTLMELGHYETAKSYILFRSEKDKAHLPDIFRPRETLKPFEYPDLYEFVAAIRHSYWIHTEFNYISDIQDYKVNVNETEREIIKRAMLAISQMEVAVKNFWGDLHHKLPKAEIGGVCATFADSEVRHFDAYAHLLEILGMNEEFERILDVPVLRERYTYLNDTSAVGKVIDPKEYTKSVILFSLFIENVSLFSQFLILMSFNKHRNLFKGVSNVVEATSKEEQIHALFGTELISVIRSEHPEWFDTTTENELETFCKTSLEVEDRVVDWIFENGELDFLSKDTVKAFIKHRINKSLVSIGFKPAFEVDEKLVAETEWFDNEVIATKHVDFFQKRSINYNKRSQSITGGDLF